jgi:hypothetical protein
MASIKYREMNESTDHVSSQCCVRKKDYEGEANLQRQLLKRNFSEIMVSSQAPVAHTCNPRCRDQEDRGSRSSQGK